MFRKTQKLLTTAIRLLVLAAFFVNFWGNTQSAHAAAFTVNSNLDLPDQNPGDGVCAAGNGSCTLRAAIDETNRLQGPNTIAIPAMTIFVNSELHIYNHVGDDSVIIQGAGRNITIIDGNNSTRVFMFEARSGQHSISNLTIRNGNNQNSSEPHWNGGAIFSEAVLSLTNVTIKDSYARHGGGIYSQYAFDGNVPVLNLNSVLIDGNNAGEVGGGLYNGSVLDGFDVSITNNHSAWVAGGYYNNSYQSAQLTNFDISSNDAREGGGIDNDLGVVTLVNGKIDNNAANCCQPGSGAATGGGGIYNNQGTMYLTAVSITNNRAPSYGGYGGGIYNAQVMHLDCVSLTNNQADYGAGLMNGNYNGWPNDLRLTNVTISNNYSTNGSGGGIFNINNGHILIKNATITQNHAAIVGGIDTLSSNTLIQLQNTILAGNNDDFGVLDCRGNLYSLGNNIVGDPDGAPIVGRRCYFSQMATDHLFALPNLGPLTGGLAYHPLLPNSLGIDQGQNSGCPSIDIREVGRPHGAYCDIGSYEYQTEISLFLPMVIR